MKYVFLVFWLGAVGLAGCVESINVEFDSCQHNGETLSVGAVVPTESGCGTCTCQPDGMMQCDDVACCVAPDGTSIAPGTAWSDGCTTCECGADGSFGCSSGAPCGCGAPPACEDVMGCVGTAVCDEAGGWSCTYDCIDTCDPTNMPMCGMSPECVTEVYCDEETDTWICGPTTCDCVGSPGECVATPGCSSNLVCDMFSGTWYCEEICPCGEAPPECGYFTTPGCTDEAWECQSMGSFCGDTVAPCPIHADFNCVNFPICDVMLQAWTCVEECMDDYCPGPPDPCPPAPLGCSYFDLCQLNGWACVLHCE